MSLAEAINGNTFAETVDAEVVSVEVHRSRYSTSFPIDELTVTLATGDVMHLVRKDLAWDSLLPEARNGKPRFLHNPAREAGVYEALLPAAPEGTARLHGVLSGSDGASRFLLLERFDGLELFQVGNVARWEATARWIARFHAEFSGRAAALSRVDHLPLHIHDAAWLARWADRASAAASGDRRFETIQQALPELSARLAAMDVSVVHGELYASNVLVDGERVCPVDWEMTAIAPPLVDLAALTAGSWSPENRLAIEYAYCDEMERDHDTMFVNDLDCCRLALCVQWLGWSPGWQAPQQHAHDWLGEALTIIQRLGLS